MARKIEITGTNTKKTIASHNTIILDVIRNLIEILDEGEIIKSINVTVDTIDSDEVKEHNRTISAMYPLGSFRYPQSDADDYSRGCCDEL